MSNIIEELKKIGTILLNNQGGMVHNNSIIVRIQDENSWYELKIGIDLDFAKKYNQKPYFSITGKSGNVGKTGKRLKAHSFGQVAGDLNIPIIKYISNFHLMNGNGNRIDQIENSWYWLSEYQRTGSEQDKENFLTYFGKELLSDDPLKLFSEEDLNEIKLNSRTPIKQEWEPRRIIIEQKLKALTEELCLVWG